MTLCASAKCMAHTQFQTVAVTLCLDLKKKIMLKNNKQYSKIAIDYCHCQYLEVHQTSDFLVHCHQARCAIITCV